MGAGCGYKPDASAPQFEQEREDGINCFTQPGQNMGAFRGWCSWRNSDELPASLEALCRKRVGSFGDDDPGYEVCDGSDAGEETKESGEDADESDVPAIVDGKSGADSSDDPVIARTGKLAGAGIVARLRRRRCGDSGSAGRTEMGGRID
jgi:hypothetical protein